MKKFLTYGVIIIIGVWYIFRPLPIIEQPKENVQREKNMKLTSSAFLNEGKIPVTYTCDGTKVSPPLSISGVPEGTKSLAMIVDDPDAPLGTFTHWIIWNLGADITKITSGKIPSKSQEGTNSAGRIGYTPPCPPNGSHRYFFTLFALDTMIGLDGKAKKADLENAMKGHIIEQTNLIGSYERISR